MKRKFLICIVLIVMLVSSFTTGAFAAEAPKEIVSPALEVLAEQNAMAAWAVRGNTIKFDSDFFARAMNLARITSITVTEPPAASDGELLLGSTVVNAGQTISAANLSLLSYDAKSDDISSSSFRFRVGDNPLEMTCRLYLLAGENSAPTVSLAPEISLNVSTFKNISFYGTLGAYDPDGDALTIEIVSYPKAGLINLTDRSSGEYVYTPAANYTGKDSFTYVARDIYGNYSGAQTVNLRVNKNTASIVYSDMLESKQLPAALAMTAAGIMSGTQVGGNHYFYPAQSVSRIEFLVMAMNASGVKDIASVSKTEFADDDDIPLSMKGYVAEAKRLGYIKGTYVDDKLCFNPNEEITRAQAANIICNIICASAPLVTPVFADSSDIPAWAQASVYSLNALGVMPASAGKISPNEIITRGDAAQMLTALMQLAK